MSTIDKVREWYTFTSYYRNSQSSELPSRPNSISSLSQPSSKRVGSVLETIPEQYDE